MTEFLNTSILDLINTTQFVHHIRPDLKSKFVYAVEKFQLGDRSIVLHLVDQDDEEYKDTELFILSLDYISEYSKTKGNPYGNTTT